MSQNWPLRPSRNSEAGGSRRKYPRCAEWGGSRAARSDKERRGWSERRGNMRTRIPRYVVGLSVLGTGAGVTVLLK